MKLIIDIGNTIIKIALFDNKRMLRVADLNVLSDINIRDFLSGDVVSKGILSSVKEIDDQAIKIIKKYNLLLLDENTLIPIKNHYKTPRTLGKDRIAACVGAHLSYPSKNILILDLGTCLTIDYVNQAGEYTGGRISPGLTMRYKALHEFTDKLPLAKIKNKSPFFGDDTNSSINSGVQRGMIAEIDVVIDTFMKEKEDSCVIFTGGDCFFFEKELKNQIFANPFLVIEGLKEILDYNA